MRSNPIQATIVLVIGLACIWAVLEVATNWASWVVFGVLIVTALGAAIALYPRRYPTRKRAYTRSSEDKYRGS